MPYTTLEARIRQSTLVAELLLELLDTAFSVYNRRSNIGNVFPDLLIVWVIRANDGRNGPPLTIREIGRRAGLPYGTLQRRIDILIRQKVLSAVQLTRRRVGYVGDTTYFDTKIAAPLFERAAQAIIAAHDALMKLRSN